MTENNKITAEAYDAERAYFFHEDTYMQSTLSKGKRLFLIAVILIVVLRGIDMWTHETAGQGLNVLSGFIGLLVNLFFIFHLYRGRKWALIVVYLQMGLSASSQLFALIDMALKMDARSIILSSVNLGILGFNLWVFALNSRVKIFIEYVNKNRKGVQTSVYQDK